MSKKTAVLVGINAYKDFPLYGCVNDVKLVKELLTLDGFKCSTLLDRNARRENILNEISSKIKDCEAGDIFVFHYSGHGTQVPDLSGDEKDELDECLVSYDYDWENMLLDDDLNDIFVQYPDVSIEVILDACHSGSGTRSVLNSMKEIHSRFITPPKEILQRLMHKDVTVNPIKLGSVITWSGCKDDQTSADANIDGTYHGAFSFALCNNIKQTRKQTIRAVCSYLKGSGFTQEAQLTCAIPDKGGSIFSNEKSLLNALKVW